MRTTKEQRVNYIHEGRPVAPCPNGKICGGTILEQWRKEGWIEGKCDACGEEVGYPLVFSLPAKGGRR